MRTTVPKDSRLNRVANFIAIAIILVPIGFIVYGCTGFLVAPSWSLDRAETRVRRLSDEEAAKIAHDARMFLLQHLGDSYSFNMRIDGEEYSEVRIDRPSEGPSESTIKRGTIAQVSIPDSIKELRPRRLYGQEGKLYISLAFAMDEGVSINAEFNKSNGVELTASFGEGTQNLRLFPR